MSSKVETMNSKVETLDINLDEIFSAAPGGDAITLPEESKESPKQKSIFTRNEKSDFTFADPDKDDADDLIAKTEEAPAEEVKETAEEVKAEEGKEVENLNQNLKKKLVLY